MPIDVICPKCQTKLRAPEEVVGKYVRCKKCQERFKVPNPGAPVDSVGDTQQLSVVEMPVQPPKIAPVAPAEALMLDDSAFEDPIPAPAKAPVVPKPAPAADPFSFGGAADDEEDRPKKRKRDEDDEEEEERPRKKKTRDEDEEVAAEEPPKKKKRPRDEDEDEEEERPRKKKEKPLIGGEPTFAMPGIAEDPAPAHVPPPAHIGQFAFEEPPPAAKGKKKRADEDEDDEPRPKTKKKRGGDDEDEDDDDDRPKSKGKKPAKSKKMLYILGGVALLMLLGCGGAATAVYVFVYRVADGVSKATINFAGPTVKEETKVTPATRPTKPTGKEKEPPVPSGAPVTPFVVPTGLQNGTMVAPGTSIPLPFAPDFVKQVQRFDDPEFGAMLFAIYQSNPGFNGAGSEDTVVRFDIAKKAVSGQFAVPADGIPGPRLYDISDSGYRVAIESPKGRLTVYSFADKAADAPLDVHAGLPQREGIAAIAFADPEGRRVAVVDKTGAVDVWDAKERQRVVTGKPDPSKAGVVAERRKPRAGKGHLASKDSIRAVLWNTGDAEPPVKLPAKTGAPTLLAVRDLQDHFAIVHIPEGSIEREVLVVDKAGVAVWRVPLPAAVGAPRTLRWVGAGATLAVGFEPANGLLLLDFASKIPTVYLKPAQEKTTLNDTGELYLVPDPKAIGKAALVQASIPADKLATFVETAKTGKAPERVYVKPEGLSQ